MLVQPQVSPEVVFIRWVNVTPIFDKYEQNNQQTSCDLCLVSSISGICMEFLICTLICNVYSLSEVFFGQKSQILTEHYQHFYAHENSFFLHIFTCLQQLLKIGQSSVHVDPTETKYNPIRVTPIEFSATVVIPPPPFFVFQYRDGQKTT